jgi:cytochrome c553
MGDSAVKVSRALLPIDALSRLERSGRDARPISCSGIWARGVAALGGAFAARHDGARGQLLTAAPEGGDPLGTCSNCHQMAKKNDYVRPSAQAFSGL